MDDICKRALERAGPPRALQH